MSMTKNTGCSNKNFQLTAFLEKMIQDEVD